MSDPGAGDGFSHGVQMVRVRGFVPGFVLTVMTAGCSDGGSSSTPQVTAPTPTPPVLRTIVEVTRANVLTGPAVPEQSVTIVGGSYNNIRFSWIVRAGENPAPGNLYILTQVYEGRIRELGPAVPGFVARSLLVQDGEYFFDPSITLQAGAVYWFAADRETLYMSSQRTSDLYEGGDLYSGGGDELGEFRRMWIEKPSERIDANFRLRGALVP